MFWAMLVFALVRLVQPRATIAISGWIAFGIAVLVELSQLYHAPWIEQVREFRLAVLALGTTFNWPDIAAYGLGVLIGALLDRAATRSLRSLT